jgi:protein involved in polysaccharide export with SLBB domain
MIKRENVLLRRNEMKMRVLIALCLILAQSVPVWASELEIVEQDKSAVAQPEAPALQAVPENDLIQVPAEPVVATEPVVAAVPETEAKIVRATDEKRPTAAQQGKKVMPLPPDYAKKATVDEPTRYTLGPDDVIEVIVRRHPEFSGMYPINGEGKIQYKFVGDIEVKGLTKTEVKDRVMQILSKYIITPEVEVTILEYRSKVIYVIGEVGAPGKYYMKSDKISLREAVIQAGLPMLTAAMRRTTLVRPDKNGKPTSKKVDLYALLYEGKLNLDLEMVPGDVVVVPATLMTKIFRVISPVTTTAGTAQSAASTAAGY